MIAYLPPTLVGKEIILNQKLKNNLKIIWEVTYSQVSLISDCYQKIFLF